MNLKKCQIGNLVMCLFIAITLLSCSSTEGDTSTSTTQVIDTSLFNTASIISVNEVTKTMSDGSSGVCFAIKIKSIAPDHTMGPYCPTNTTQSVGVWVDPTLGATAVNASYLNYLEKKGWDIVDDNGNVRICSTDDDFKKVAAQEVGGWTLAQATASGVINRCVAPTSKEQSTTVYIPKFPKKASSPMNDPKGVVGARLPGVGIALNGILLFPPEPTDRIMTYQNIAPFDNLGGHVGFSFDYHYHRAWHVSNATTKILGYALDGYPIYTHATEPDGITVSGLDARQGHTYGTFGYHYHEKDDYVTGGLTGIYAIP
jgi:hypothetical protein